MPMDYDKSEWPQGPWSNESDKVQWQDAATGLPCMILRAPIGHLCGYVGIPKGHDLYSIDYMECPLGDKCDECEDTTYSSCSHTPDSTFMVHGMVTFSGRHPDHTSKMPDDTWWFGFDCAHFSDFVPGLVRGNYNPGGTYRDIAYVMKECKKLAQQLEG